MRNKRPPTRMVRIRLTDIEEMRKLAKEVDKKLPDFQKELINAYKRARKIR